MRILITGGAGFLGNELVRQLYDRCERIVIFSRDEHKHSEMQRIWPEYPDNKMRYMLGDIRNVSRLAQAMRGCDAVIHAAAMKEVPAAEYNPQEAVYTNVIGGLNVVDACNVAGVRKCMFVSTDKAVESTTLYGMTKAVAERIAISGNNLGKCRFSACRYGNVMGSTASVIPVWRKQAADGKPVTLTCGDMTRWWEGIETLAAFLIRSFDEMQGGEVFVPKMTASTVRELAIKTIGHDNLNFKEIGIRPAEKMHETLVSEVDARDCWDCGGHYVIYPPFHEWIKDYAKKGDKVDESFRYRSCD